jgi:arylsulfatase
VALILAALLLAGVTTGCNGGRSNGARRPLAHRGPIVLITLDALRADAVGAFGGPPLLMPALDGLAREATWAGRAIAPSSWTVPAMASIFTGLQPWTNQNLHGNAAALRPDVPTLPEALKKLGFATAGYHSNVWLKKGFGYDRGFDEFWPLGGGRRAENQLATLGAGPAFLWAHILPPHAPYVRRDDLLARLPEAPPELPARVTVLALEPWFDPAVPLPDAKRRVFRAMYQLNVAAADEALGRLLAALRRSGQWDRTLLVVTADHGEEFKECGQVEHGGNLCRPLLEVPLLIKLPKGWQGPPLLLRAGDRPGTARLRATLVEAAGGEAGARTAPSLFHSGGPGVLSELYLGNGVNRFSWVEDDRQLLWESRFAPAEPEYFAVHTLDLGGRPAVMPRTPPEQLHARLEKAFGRTLPLSGGSGPPALTLWRWPPAAAGAPLMTSEVAPLADQPREVEMARRLRAAWLAANGREAPAGVRAGVQPGASEEEAAELQALGYAARKPQPKPVPTPEQL